MRDHIPGVRYIGRMRENTALDAAFTTLDDASNEFGRAYAVAEEAEQRLQNLPPAPSFTDSVEDVLDAGHLPEDFNDWVDRNNHAADRREAQATALANIRTYATGRCWALFTTHTPQLLIHLNGQLAELIDQSRAAAATLAGIDDAHDVLRAGAEAAAAFATLDEQWRHYMTIRAAQNRIVRDMFDEVLISNCHTPHLPNDAATDLWFANLDTVFPDWRPRKGQSQKVTVGRTGVYADPITAPWPPAGPLQLAWFINHNARFWVPTERQVRELHESRLQPTPVNVAKRKGPEQRRRERVLRAGTIPA